MGDSDSVNVRKKVLDAVKKGASLRQTSKKYNIPLSTVALWCDNADIKSNHSRSPLIATDKQIIKTIKKHRVCSQKELEEELGYSTNTLRRRLLPLIQAEKINYIVLPGGGGKVSNLFKGYIDKRLYYMTKKDLHRWIEAQLPKHLPNILKRTLTQKLHNAGIDFEFEKMMKKAIVVEESLYKNIKTKAEKKKMSVPEYLKSVT